jgi:hypothetical protein
VLAATFLPHRPYPTGYAPATMIAMKMTKLPLRALGSLAWASLLVPTLLAGCGGKHRSRGTPADAAKGEEVSPAGDTAPLVVDSSRGGEDVSAGAPDAASEGGAGDVPHGSDGGPDAAVDQGGNPLDGGLDGSLDGGLDGGGLFRCNFAGVQPGLACSDGQFCSSFIGGPVGSVPSYSCAPIPAACLTNRTCECLCAMNSTSFGCPDPARPYGSCTCIPGQGYVTMMCAAP